MNEIQRFLQLAANRKHSWSPLIHELARAIARFEDAEQAGLEAAKKSVGSDFSKALAR